MLLHVNLFLCELFVPVYPFLIAPVFFHNLSESIKNIQEITDCFFIRQEIIIYVKMWLVHAEADFRYLEQIKNQLALKVRIKESRIYFAATGTDPQVCSQLILHACKCKPETYTTIK